MAAEHYRAGRLAEAESLYRSVLDKQPDNVEAIQGLAAVCHQRGRPDEALVLFRRAIALDPNSRVADRHLGRLLEQRGDSEGAAICYRRAARLRPLDAAAHADLARTLAGQGEVAEAIGHCRRAVALAPGEAWTHIALGNALLGEGAVADASASYQRALAISPDLAEAHSNWGDALRRMGRLSEAVAACERALVLKPELAEAHNNLGNALREQGRLEPAISHYQEALRLKPDWPEVHNNFAIALQEQGRTAEAVEHYERALSLNSGFAEVHQNLGSALAQSGRTVDAIAALRRALALKPDYPEALVQVAHLNGELCDWRHREAETAQVLDLMRRHPGLVPPFNLQAQQSTPAEQLLCGQQWSQRIAQGRSPGFTHDRSCPPGKIRLGYLSADFRDHPVAYAIAETIERHDRTRFEVLGYSYGPDDGSALRRRLETGFDRFIDLHATGNDEAARQISTDGVHVLVDLTGYTRLARPRILVSRPAPIQVNFLGFLGTMGAEFIDYIIVDPFIAPSSQQAFYSEKLVHLAGGWWPAGIRWEIAEDARRRADYGLPEDGFVFCCFNASYKITPPIFDVWMGLLRATPQSVLWLGHADSAVQNNLRREAAQRGIGAERLVFAAREPMAGYLARHRHADLFLDTLPYNAVGTAYHAQLAGLPVLTCAGETFAGRTAGAMLLAAELPELVTFSIEEYERTALRLAREADLLTGIRQRLARARSSSALFDGERAVRELENAFRECGRTGSAARLRARFRRHHNRRPDYTASPRHSLHCTIQKMRALKSQADVISQHAIPVACERVLKRAVPHCKNALFYRTPHGSEVGSIRPSRTSGQIAGVKRSSDSADLAGLTDLCALPFKVGT
jgi:predicted O-linked N-acetylglucosamine transferase (SPINDLY family)